jgi:D-erythro-7,8-dihydroneopterin triphosphate epimerase
VDRILIRDLLVRCVLGIHDEERRDKQDVVINIALGADLRASGEQDRFDEALDYSSIKKRVIAAVESSRFHLLEALAEHVARVCLESPGVREAQVTIDKPGALRFARSVAVEVTRRRD